MGEIKNENSQVNKGGGGGGISKSSKGGSSKARIGTDKTSSMTLETGVVTTTAEESGTTNTIVSESKGTSRGGSRSTTKGSGNCRTKEKSSANRNATCGGSSGMGSNCITTKFSSTASLANTSNQSDVINQSSLISQSDMTNQPSVISQSNVTNQPSVISQSNVTNQSSLISQSNVINQSSLISQSNVTNQSSLISQSNVINQSSLISQSDVINQSSLTNQSNPTNQRGQTHAAKAVSTANSATSTSTITNTTGNTMTSKNSKGGNSKSRSTGKALSSLSKINDSYALIFPNALPVKQVMWGLDPLNKVWRYCSIVYARPKNKNLNDLNFIFPLSINKNEIINKISNELSASNASMKECDYDYYVHWEKFDRRLDCWLAYEKLRSLDQDPDDGLPFIRDTENGESDNDEHAGIDKEYLREHEENTKLKTINQIKFGKYLIDTWYFSPYPKEYQNIDILYICEFCLTFFKENGELIRHTERCEIRHPPGNEIYRNEKISIFEIDGNYFRIYCENLCFLSKLFLDHKTLKHRVNLFLFYVITEYDQYGYHITGYFSKEKYSKNNVSCILTLPQHQKKGYGKFLINFSYFLSQTEKRTGTPERPLSDLGVASYMAYWYETLLKVLVNYEQLSIQELSEITSIETNDIISCLEEKEIFKTVANGDTVYYINPQQLEFVLGKIGQKNYDLCRTKLHWVSYDYHLAMYE
ncbi:histone acetyltransferase [Plasmodium gonderi]|uniref:Histone acetyltransferase n=1 Tax=Plasmodium gonderi TaxID=77519 RepID=A0A1Y1JLM3_PLAGO|nr:histone acetyltransferase [Plasmodium gonderi]GAW80954.1 histone acetyltransferase [Plasmodium gonderi]